MKVERDLVVSFHYELTGEDGEPFDSSRGCEPVAILHGHGNPGLEAALAGRVAGERFAVAVPPGQAYGPRRDGSVQRFPKKRLDNPRRLEPGARTVVRTANGPPMVTVVKVGSSIVDVDLNHPMAGRTLHSTVEIVGVRAAEPPELEGNRTHLLSHPGQRSRALQALDGMLPCAEMPAASVA